MKKRVWIEILTALFAGALLFAAATTTPPSASKKKVTKKSSTTKANSTKRRKKPAVASWRSTQKAPSPERYKEIQQALVDKGYLKSEPNGAWDTQSMDALRQFQTDKKLSPTGKLSSASLIALGLGPKTATSYAAQPAAPVGPPGAAPLPAPPAAPQEN